MRQTRLDDRRYRRVPAVVRVCDRSDFHDTYEVSCGGFSLATPRPLPKGTRATFTLGLECPVELVGEVTWVRQDGDRPGMGVRIVQASETSREWLESFVQKLIKDADRL